MRLLQPLLSRLYRAMVIDPDAFTAMRLSHPSGIAWSVAEGDLTVTVGSGPPVVYDLFPHTLLTLAAQLASDGIFVTNLHPDQRDRGAICLIEGGGGDIDPLLGHDNLIWAVMDSLALELQPLNEAAAASAGELAIQTATGIFLRELGRDYFGIPPLPGEEEPAYAARVVRELLRPRSNNFAMEAIIEEALLQPVQVLDVIVYGPVVPVHDGAIDHDGTYTYSATALPIYGLFDVVTGFDLLGAADIVGQVAIIHDHVERCRAGGYLLRQVEIRGGEIGDVAPGPSQDPDGVESLGLAWVLDIEDAPTSDDAAPEVSGVLVLNETTIVPAEADTEITASYSHTFDGSWTFDGSHPYASGTPITLPF